MPAAPSSPIGPAVGQLLTAADGLGGNRALLLQVLDAVRRTLQSVDADALDDAAGAWAQQRTALAPGARRVIAVDGKTLRGSGLAGQPGRHLLAALDHACGVVLGQVDVEAKTNETNECVWPGGHPGEMKWSGGPPGAVVVGIVER
jgi:hypothetical protein